MSEYIHLNPLLAGLLTSSPVRLEGYLWSSFPGFCGNATLAPWLQRARVFGGLRKRKGQSVHMCKLTVHNVRCFLADP